MNSGIYTITRIPKNMYDLKVSPVLSQDCRFLDIGIPNDATK